MSRSLGLATLILLGGILGSAATCPQPGAGANILNDSSLECSVGIDNAQLSWNISSLQIVAANTNVSSGGVTFGFTTSTSSGVEHLSVSETIDPSKLGGWNANSTVYIAVEYALSLGGNNNAPAPDETKGKQRPPAKSEIQNFINGQLAATFTDHSVLMGPGKPGALNIIKQGLTIYVQDILMLNAKDLGSGTFVNGFDFVLPNVDPPPGGPGTPGEVPEPASLALLGAGLVAVAWKIKHSRADSDTGRQSRSG